MKREKKERDQRRLEKASEVSHVEEEWLSMYGKAHAKMKIDSLKCIKVKTETNSEYTKAKKINCWICEGWVERTFTWYPEKSGRLDIDQVNNPLFVHFENEGWKPHIMQKVNYTEDILVKVKKIEPQEMRKWDEEKGEYVMNSAYLKPPPKPKYITKHKIKYVYKRMLPPGKIRYLFSQWKHIKQSADPNHKLEPSSIP